MASRDENENRLLGVVTGSLSRWLGLARDAVMRPWRQHRQVPDPSNLYAVLPAWQDELDTILTTIGAISLDAWSQATDVPPVSRHSFVVASLAQAENLLSRMPDEVYHLIFAEIADGTNAGESVDQIARRVDAVLTWSGTYWPGRARNIAVTETTRSYGSGTLAAGMEQSRLTGRLLRKQWMTEVDMHVRESHREAHRQVRDLSMPFEVGGIPLMFPGDPLGPADEVCGCRCDLVILNEGV